MLYARPMTHHRTARSIATLVFVVATSVVGCVVPSQEGAQGGDPVYAGASGAPAASAGAAPAASGDVSDLCSAACRQFSACGIESYEQCVPQCPQIKPQNLERFAASSCDELTAIINGTVGQGCMTRGTNDCLPEYVCCGGDPTTGTPGQCLYAGVCYAPTR